MASPGSSAHERDYLSPKEFGKLSGLSIATVRRYLSAGIIPHAQPAGSGCRICIPRYALDQYLDQGKPNRSEPPPSQTTESVPIDQDKPLPGPRPRWMRTRQFDQK